MNSVALLQLGLHVFVCSWHVLVWHIFHRIIIKLVSNQELTFCDYETRSFLLFFPWRMNTRNPCDLAKMFILITS